jgi:hypothetical protein
MHSVAKLQDQFTVERFASFEKDVFYTYYQHMLLHIIYVRRNFPKTLHYVILVDAVC